MISEDHKQQDREDRTGRRWEIENRRGPNIGEPCEKCGGEGHIECTHDQGCCASPKCPGWECQDCNGTGRVPFGLLSECPSCEGWGVRL